LQKNNTSKGINTLEKAFIWKKGKISKRRRNMKVGQTELGVYPLWAGFWIIAIILLVLLGR
jgi:triphosphoribosyl-dephospho-CoA synthetase